MLLGGLFFFFKYTDWMSHLFIQHLVKTETALTVTAIIPLVIPAMWVSGCFSACDPALQYSISLKDVTASPCSVVGLQVTVFSSVSPDPPCCYSLRAEWNWSPVTTKKCCNRDHLHLVWYLIWPLLYLILYDHSLVRVFLLPRNVYVLWCRGALGTNTVTDLG